MVRRKTNAEFVAEVRGLTGDEYTFLEEYKTTREKIKVRHRNCGHIYSVVPRNFLRGKRCPKCSTAEMARKKTKSHADFIDEVNELVASEYSFLEKYKGTLAKIRVRHNKCGRVYCVKPGDFLIGRRCPKCSGVAKKTNDEFIAEVKELVGDEYTVLGEYKNANTKIRIAHNKCQFVYHVRPYAFLSGNRCPRCSRSKGEDKISSFLEAARIPYISEYAIKYAKNQQHLRIDFLACGVAIEYDGIQHFKSIEIWGGERALRETQRRDRIKNEYCEKHGIPMIRIPYWDFDRIDEILTDKLLPIIRNKDDKLA